MQLVLLALEILEESLDAAEVVIAFHHPALRVGRQPVVRHIEGNAAQARQPLHLVIRLPITGLCPGLDRALGQRLAFVRDHQVQIKIDRVAESLAARARSVRIVEREKIRLRLRVGNLAALAFETFIKHQSLGRDRCGPDGCRKRRALPCSGGVLTAGVLPG